MDLQPVLPALAEAFTHATGIKLVVIYGNSATLAKLLLAGDPADLFLATDYSFPEKIVAANLADSPAPIAYARGTLVLWARADSPLQPLTQNTLRDPRVQSLAIADPDHIPYGRAAVAALTRMKLYDQLKPHLIVAEDLAQTAQLVESGNAQLGFLSLIAVSTPHAKQVGSFIRMPPSAYPEIRECAVVLKNSTHNADAHVFLDWLRSSTIQQALPAYGLDPVQ
jgi:molybdate transport system substrate-binding protein